MPIKLDSFTQTSGKSFDVRRMPGFTSIAAFCLIGLYAPLVMLILFSFNATRSVAVSPILVLTGMKKPHEIPSCKMLHGSH